MQLGQIGSSSISCSRFVPKPGSLISWHRGMCLLHLFFIEISYTCYAELFIMCRLQQFVLVASHLNVHFTTMFFLLHFS